MKGRGFESLQERRENFLLQGQLSVLTLIFGIRSIPRVTAVARKRSRSFCQKCRWQVTAKQVYTLRMWPYVCALNEVTRCTVVWCTQNLRRDGSSFMWHQPCQRCKYTTSVYIQKRAVKKASHSCRITCERSESARERRIALFKSDRNHQLRIDIPTGFQRPYFFLFFFYSTFFILNLCLFPVK